MTHQAKHIAQLRDRIHALDVVAHACGGMPAALRGHYAALLEALQGWQTDIGENRAIGVAKVYGNRSGPNLTA